MTHGFLKHATYPPHIQKAIVRPGLAARRPANSVPADDRMAATARRNLANDIWNPIGNRWGLWAVDAQDSPPHARPIGIVQYLRKR